MQTYVQSLVDIGSVILSQFPEMLEHIFIHTHIYTGQTYIWCHLLFLASNIKTEMKQKPVMC